MNKVTQAIVLKKVMNLKKLYEHNIYLSGTQAHCGMKIYNFDKTPMTLDSFKNYIKTHYEYYTGTGGAIYCGGYCSSTQIFAYLEYASYNNSLQAKAVTSTGLTTFSITTLTDNVKEVV